jgi:hypothetical protein
VLALLSGCSHEEAFLFQGATNNTPLTPVDPTRLTFGSGEDQYPSWLPDGSGLLFSFVDPVSGDRCVGKMAPGGGQVAGFHCPATDPRNDSLDLAIEPSAAAQGEVAWIELHSAPERQIHDRGALILGLMDARAPAREVLAFPYTSPSGTVHLTATNLRWLPHNRLAYIGSDILIRGVCFGCKPDSVLITREVMIVDLAQPGSAPVTMPGTSEATSIWPTADSTGLYYTLAGDRRVWRRSLDGDLPAEVHDFGAAGIVRDVSVVGDRMVAIVGGKVNYGFEAAIGLRQVDSGGTIAVVDLGTDRESVLSSQLRFRRPVLSPDGRAVAVEGLLPPQTHPDLWLYQVP